MIITRSTLNNFTNHIEFPTDVNDCWIWLGGRCGKGSLYGAFAWRASYKYHQLPAHRFSYIYVYGGNPPHVDHTCRTKLCVNPLHLEGVSVALNKQRAMASIEYCWACMRKQHDKCFVQFPKNRKEKRLCKCKVCYEYTD